MFLLKGSGTLSFLVQISPDKEEDWYLHNLQDKGSEEYMNLN